VGAPAAPVKVTGGGSVSVSLTVSPVGGAFNGVVTLSPTGLPAGATYTFSPASVTPGSSAVATTMTIQTAVQAAELPANHKSPWPWTSTLLISGVCLMGSRRRRVPRSLAMVLATAALAAAGTLALPGCGGGSMSSPAPQSQGKSYTITVTGSSGSFTSAPARFTLIVQ
jgi:hypothetical protein